jgi:NSS family neurotransmitter:Na+ symporter
MKRETFKTQLGFLLSALGGALGIANLITLPGLLYEHGILFLVSYVCFTILIGIPLMTSEIAIGRNGSTNAVNAYLKVGQNKNFKFIGYLNTLSCFVFAGMFSLVLGWCLNLSGEYVIGTNKSFNLESYTKDSFGNNLLYSLVAIIIAVAIITFGIRKGIERVSKIVLPFFAIVLIAFTIKNGVDFFGSPSAEKFSTILFKLPDNWQSMLTDALGQSFFSLSLGAGIFLVYGSYIGKEVSISKIVNRIIHIDTVFAIICFIFLLPLLTDEENKFQAGLDAIFVSLVHFFNSMPRIWGVVFFISISFIVIEMVISVLEPVISFVSERFLNKYSNSRQVASILVGVAILLITIPFQASFGASDFLTKFYKKGEQDQSFFALLYEVFVNFAMPLSGLAISLFISRVWGVNNFLKEVFPSGAGKAGYKNFLCICLKRVTPLLLIVILFLQVKTLFQTEENISHEAFIKSAREAIFKYDPEEGSALGDHIYDDKFKNWAPAVIAEEIMYYDSW